MLMASSMAGFAQQVTKQVVNVEDFSNQSGCNANEVEIVRNNVINSLQATKRIIVVDLKQQNLVKAEAERRKSEAAMNDNHEVAEITQLNANYIIRGVVNSIDTQTRRSEYKGKVSVSWTTELKYTIQLIDPSTGATQNSYNYSASATSYDNASDSRRDAVANSAKNMKKFIEDAFPVKGTILQVAEGDSKKAKTVYINLGTDQGIQKGQKFVVYAVVDVAGEKSEKEIGTLTAAEVMSATRTLCKVNNGGDVIAANLASNAEMTIKTRATKGFFANL